MYEFYHLSRVFMLRPGQVVKIDWHVKFNYVVTWKLSSILSPICLPPTYQNSNNLASKAAWTTEFATAKQGGWRES